MAILVLLQKDLRLRDNPALFHAVATKKPLIITWVHEQKLGDANKWWVYESLKLFQDQLAEFKIPLLYIQEINNSALCNLVDYLNSKVTIEKIYSNGLDFNLPKSLEDLHKAYPTNLIFLPETTKEFKIFTPFWNNLRKYHLPIKPLGKPNFGDYNHPNIEFTKFTSLPKLYGHNWWNKLQIHWKPGEESAQKSFSDFKKHGLKKYSTCRDYFSTSPTSKLSPHIRFGEISVRQIYHELSEDNNKFLAELGWREFAYHVLNFHREIQTQPLNPKYKDFYPKYAQDFLEAWKKGRSGYPIVDAAMRELWETGWMHNRLRMITASFLTKNLLIPWQIGQSWFFDCLVDADVASNSINWQWVAGCGTDSAPYFRVFNPILQGKTYDPSGLYVKKWIKELEHIEDKFIHYPFLASTHINYLSPLVDLKESRLRAINEYKNI